MFATDFVFNGQKASDYELVICSFDGGLSAASGGEMEYAVVKPPNSDEYEFYGGQFNTVLEWNFSVMKNPCKYTEDEELFFSKYEERQLFKWLQKRDDYYWFRFLDDDSSEEIWYKVTINIIPHQFGGKTIGFDLTATANSSYGFSPTITRTAVIDSETPLILYVDTDSQNYILPVVDIIGTGTFTITNESDPGRKLKPAKFIDVDVNKKIHMNSEYGIITGIPSPDNFNWNFLRLIDGKNIIKTNSDTDIYITFEYNEIRRVIV